jgi:hypothetical protein
MVAPTEERPQVILLLPIPLSYQATGEGSTMAPPAAPKSSHAKPTSEKQKSEPKAVATPKVTSKSKVEQLPPARPVLPPAKPPFIEPAPRANPTKADGPSLQSVKPPPFLPPPPPPVLELDIEGNMTYRYSRHHTHAHKPEKEPQPRAARAINIPPPPPGFPGFPPEAKPVEQCTLTIYHVCRICMRPRSEKYHLEHPIPASGVPPPPGICRRCRIKCVDQKDDHTEVVHVEESDKVRVGISAFLPKDSLYTQKEANEATKKQHEKGYGERFIREESSDEEDPDRVVYRYIKRTRKSGPDPPADERAEVSAENLAAMNLMNDRYSVKSDRIKASLEARDETRVEVSPSTRYYAEEIRVAGVTRAESSESSAPASAPARSLKSRPPTVTTCTRGPSTKTSVSVKTSVAGSQSNVQATAQVTGPDTPGFTESEIRIFARDEVERYRQAERMVHAHPNAFTHGRLVHVPAVPVERRIEVVTDEAVPKPWEGSSLPPPRAVFATRRSEKSAASKDEPDYVERARSEDSRHWYRVADNATSGTKSSSSQSSSTRAKEQPPSRAASRRSESQRYEHDVEVVVERGRIPPQPPMPPLPPQQIPDSDPPGSVKLKEVVGMIREEPMRAKQPSVGSERRHDMNTIEVIEEIELPPPRSHVRSTSIRSTDPVVSQRVKILRGEPDPQRQQRNKHAAPKEREEASVRTDKSYWEADGTVRSASGYSSVRQGFRTEIKADSEQHSSRAERDAVVKETVVFAVPSSRQDLPRLSSHGRSDDAEWYTSRVKSVKKHQQAPDNLSYDHRPEVDNDDDKTVWPADDQPVRAAASERPSLREPASERPSLREDWDWEYKKRVVTAIDRPDGDHERARERQITERTFRRRRPSESATQTEEANEQSSVRNRSRAQEIQLPPAAPPSPKFSLRSRIETGPAEDRGRGPYMQSSEESAHVRFASKIDFSPTPPRSSESLPEAQPAVQSKPSSQTSKGGHEKKKSALRNQIDGGASEPPESAEDLISAYEANRASRGRSTEKREDLEYVSAKFASSAKGSALSTPEVVVAASARSEPRSFQSQPSRRAVFEREDNPPRETEERRWRSSRRDDVGRRSSPSGGGDTETATQLSRQRRLARALSESPSRENMRLLAQRQQEQDAEMGRGRQDWHGEEEDGKGPYREEARTESMDALYGSGTGGPQEKEREYVVCERW